MAMPDTTPTLPGEDDPALLRLTLEGAEAEVRALRDRLGETTTALGIATREAADASATRDALAAELAAARAELAGLRGSTSWRVTAPLRAVMRLARR